MAQSCLANNGEVIKRHIKEKGLTQAKFAEIVDYDERTVRKWIQKGVYDYRLLVKIADIFEIDVCDLFLQ